MTDWYREEYDTLRADLPDTAEKAGLFYDSRTKLRHIALYIPNRKTPTVTMCGRYDTNFSGTGVTESICPLCERALKDRLG